MWAWWKAASMLEYEGSTEQAQWALSSGAVGDKLSILLMCFTDVRKRLGLFLRGA